MTNAGADPGWRGGGGAAVEFWIVYYRGFEIKKNIDKKGFGGGLCPSGILFFL